MPEKILLIEDEEKMARMVELELRHEGYAVEKAFDGVTGLEQAEKGGFDLVLLDIMLPGMSGMEVLRRLRRTSSVPVILLTARDAVMDKVSGLDSGADDYITKPFKNRELMARVKANIRRMSVVPAAQAPKPMEDQPLGERMRIDTDRAVISKDGVPLDLTQREYDLIRFLAARPGKIFSREALMEHVWNYEGYVGDVRAVDVAVRRLREKIEDDPAAPAFIKTKRGMGYYFGE